DTNANNGLDHWGTVTGAPDSDSTTLYCSGVGGVAGDSHVLFYDTAEEPIGYLWSTGDADGGGTDAV
ncbi:MAG: hypothetical protein KAT70_07490, partial [Thermoplasmata archaeon]|nr:hypothetical protein [Thermoplasmata archaeon]